MLIGLLIVPLSIAQLITIGVMPSKIEVHKGINEITFKFFNTDGEVDAYYIFMNSDEVECLENCKVLVKKGTTISNPAVYNVKLNVKNSGYIYITAKPASEEEQSGAVSIIQRVGIKVSCADCKEEANTSNGSSEKPSSTPSPPIPIPEPEPEPTPPKENKLIEEESLPSPENITIPKEEVLKDSKTEEKKFNFPTYLIIIAIFAVIMFSLKFLNRIVIF